MTITTKLDEAELKKRNAEYTSLFNSLDKKTQKIVQNLSVIQRIIENSMMHTTNCLINQLIKENCRKVRISLVGETATGELIKSKEEIIIHMVD